MIKTILEIGPSLTPAVERRCGTCGGQLTWNHDHKPDLSGIDDGPSKVRKKPPPKSAGEMAAIRGKAWETRRAKYGECGNKKYGWRGNNGS
jgi:hypothetical protein